MYFYKQLVIPVNSSVFIRKAPFLQHVKEISLVLYNLPFEGTRFSFQDRNKLYVKVYKRKNFTDIHVYFYNTMIYKGVIIFMRSFHDKIFTLFPWAKCSRSTPTSMMLIFPITSILKEFSVFLFIFNFWKLYRVKITL